MGKILISLIILLAFLAGFVSSYAVNSVYIDTEKPFLIGFSNTTEYPGNWLNEEKIEIFKDRVVIYVDNAFLSKYADTGSMLPTLGENTNGIKIIPKSPSEIDVGDIITYEEDNILIVHRVIGKGEDSNGIYFVTKGDNNNETDGKVYWDQVKYVTVALVY